jgi:hypothetical protein
MQSTGQHGTIATLACDAGDRYADTIYDDSWLASRKIDLSVWQQRFRQLAGQSSFGHDLQRAGSDGLFQRAKHL